MKRKQDFREWQATEVENQAEKERWAKQKALDEAANTYQVFVDGEVVHETHNEQEAIRTAENIRGRVLWLIGPEGNKAGIRYIYPPELTHNPRKK
jgi:hypothetical protein